MDQLRAIIYAGGNTMSDYTKKIAEQELVNSNKVSVALIIGVGVIMSMWFLSGILYVTSM